MRLCVIGGGLAGLTCAAAARQLGMDVVLLEASCFDRPRAGEHLAVEAVELLETLGLPPEFYEQVTTPCSEILSYWGSERVHVRDLMQQPSGLGLLLKRPAFDLLVADFVRDSGVRVVEGARTTRLERLDDLWSVSFQKNGIERREVADFLVDASGRNSRNSPMLGTRKIKFDKLIALNVRIPVVSAQDTLWDGRIIVEPNANGWVYAAGLPGAAGIVTVVMDGKHPHRALALSESFLGMLSETKIAKELWSDVKKNMDNLSPCSCQSQVCSNLFGKGWLLVGDAAWSADPLSAQGMLKAIRDGLDAANTINEFYQGNERAMESYQSRILGNFRSYLLDRAKYYRREQRWSGHAFWRRRYAAMLSEGEINLDPQQLLDFSSFDLNSILGQVGMVVPAIDCTLLANVLRKPARAFEMVACYQRQAESPVSDIDVVLALQAVQHWITDTPSFERKQAVSELTVVGRQGKERV